MWSLDFERGYETRLTLDDRITEFAGVFSADEHTCSLVWLEEAPPNLIGWTCDGSNEPLLPANTHLQQAEDV